MNTQIKEKRPIRPVVWALWALGLFVFCLTLAGLVLPDFLRSALEKQISRALNCPARVESLSFNPLSMTLVASNIAVPYPGDAGMFLRLGRLEVMPAFFSFFPLRPGIKELKLDSPVIDLILFENGVFSPHLFFDGPHAGSSGGTAILPFVIHNFSIHNGTVTLHDRMRGSTHLVENITLTVPFVSTLQTDKELAVTPQLSATVNGRPMSLAGETRPFSNNLRTEFTLLTEEWELERFRECLAPYTALELASGTLSTSIALSVHREEGQTLGFTLAGKAKIGNLELAGPHGAIFRAPRVELEAKDIRPVTGRIVIDNVFLDSPEITARRTADGKVDWTDFFAIPGRDDNAAPGPSVVITKAVLADGSILWHDPVMPAPYAVKKIHLTLANVDFHGKDKAGFSLEFGEGRSKCTADGTISFDPLRVEGAVNLERMPVTPFAPYLARAADVLLDGALDLRGDFSMEYGAMTRIRLGGIALHHASVILPGKTSPLLTAGHLSASDFNADVPARNITIGRISGSGVNAFLARGKDGHLALDGFTRKNTAPSGGWHIAAGRIQLESSRVVLTDRTLRDTAVLPFSDVKISASNLSTQPSGQWTADISARPGTRGALRLEARGTLDPLSVSFRVVADRADIVFLSPYVRKTVNMSLSEGLVHADIEGQIRAGGKNAQNRVEIYGNAGLHGVSLTENHKEIIGWGRLRAEKFRYRSRARSLGDFSAGTLILNGPRISVAIGEDGTTNIQRMLTRAGLSPATGPVGTPAGPVGGFSSLSLGGARITSGEIRLRDERLQPPHTLRVEHIRMESGGMSSDHASRGELEGSFRLHGSPVVLDGNINPLVAPFAGELTIDVRDLDLVAFSRYAEKFAGYPIRRGEFSARMDLALDGMDVSGRNDLMLGRLDVGDRDPSSDAPDMPIKAAIALLKDLSGNIALTLPVSGRLDDPQFRIGGVMGRTVINTMLKTVASPVRLIGDFFSIFAPAARQERMHFAPGEDRVTGRMAESLHGLVEALPKRNRARLELIGVADMREKTDMTMAEVVKKMRKMKYDALPEAEREATTPDRVRVGMHVDAEEYARLLREVYAARPDKPEGDAPKSAREMMRSLRRSASISDGQVHDLAQARAKAIRDEIVRIDESFDRRITLGPPRIIPGDGERRRIDSCVLITVR